MELRTPESLLPGEILERASVRGNEYAWRRGDLPAVFAAAEAAGVANLGGQVQFRLPTGTCELYWRDFGAGDRRHPDESWPAFVSRSRRETEASLADLPGDDVLAEEGVRQFEFLRAQASGGAEIAKALYFVCYFLAPSE